MVPLNILQSRPLLVIIAPPYRVFDLPFRLCRESNAIDFDDLLGLVVALMTVSLEAREELQDTWHHVHVDEFQVPVSRYFC